MHPSTEDLLSVRDGEPLDAVTSNVIAEDAAHAREIDRLIAMRDALRRLPDVAPPDAMWERIAAVEHDTRPQPKTWLRLAGGIGVAAAVAALAIFVVSTPSRQRGGVELPTVPLQTNRGPSTITTVEEPSTVVGTMAVFDPDRPFVGARIVPATYPALMRESAQLDRTLRRLSYQQRPIMSGETATTIAGLEARIAVIDEQLTYGNARGVPQPERTALWGERVDLMNALVHVRYAQAQ